MTRREGPEAPSQNAPGLVVRRPSVTPLCDVCGRPSTTVIAPFRVRHPGCNQKDGQLALPGSPPRVHRRDDHDTSVDAGRRSRSRIRELVLEAHRRHPDGLTDDELAELVDEYPPTLSKRRKDLTDEGLIEATLFTRPTRRGTSAIVWRITDEGR